MNHSDDSKLARFAGWAWILSFLLLFLVTTTPQLGLLGRGFRTVLPCLAFLLGSVLLQHTRPLVRVLAVHRATYVLGAVFILQGSLRFSVDVVPKELWSLGVVGPGMILLLMLVVHVFEDTQPRAFNTLRTLVALGWTAALAHGVPTLLAHPRVARETMGSEYAVLGAQIWGIRGVGEYTIYTSFALAAPLVLRHLLGLQGMVRRFGLILFTGAALAVLLSTFTMAAALLLAGLAITLTHHFATLPGAKRLVGLGMLVALATVLPAALQVAMSYEQFGWAASKLLRLVEGVTSQGLAHGEETGRGAMLMRDLDGFMGAPLLGYIPRLQGFAGEGHSSLSNSLTLYGLFFAVLWPLALSLWIVRILRGSFASAHWVAAVTSWGLWGLAGILNPTWHALTVALPLVLFSLHNRASQS